MKELFKQITEMSKREQKILKKALASDGVVSLKIKNSRVVSGQFITKTNII